MTCRPALLLALAVPAVRGLRGLLVMLVMLSGTAPAALAATGSAWPAPAGLHEEVVLSGTSVNGNRIELNRFTDPRPAHLLLAEVRRVWSQRPAPIHVESRQGWMTLTQLAGDSVETFEVRPAPTGDGVLGRRTRWRKDGAGTVAADADAWLERMLPAGSRVLNRIGNQDGDRRLTTLVAATSAAPAPAWQSLSSALARNGFSPERRLAPALQGDATARFFARGSEDIAVTISEHGGQRAIVIHYGRSE